MQEVTIAVWPVIGIFYSLVALTGIRELFGEDTSYEYAKLSAGEKIVSITLWPLILLIALIWGLMDLAADTFYKKK